MRKYAEFPLNLSKLADAKLIDQSSSISSMSAVRRFMRKYFCHAFERNERRERKEFARIFRAQDVRF